jgi:nucleoside-diphosphate-sugar epimerase
MKRVILTGASGFVGANLARRLLAEGHELHLIMRRGYQPWRIQSILNDVRIWEIDLGDADKLEMLVAQIKPEWIFHLAAHGAYSYQTDLQQIIQTNFLNTVNLVQAALKCGFEAFINTGSSSEYGYKNLAPSEQEWLEPNSYYAVTKASATMFCRYTAQTHKLPLSTLRLYSVYGPYEEPTRLIPALILRGLKGDLPPLVNPTISRDYIYVADVEEAYLAAASYPNQELGAVYNVGTGVQTSLEQLVAIAYKLLPITATAQWGSMPNRVWDTAIWVANNAKIKKDLKWEPCYKLEQGLEKTISWFQENPALLDFYYQKYT